jgi:hypothetical protein
VIWPDKLCQNRMKCGLLYERQHMWHLNSSTSLGDFYNFQIWRGICTLAFSFRKIGMVKGHTVAQLVEALCYKLEGRVGSIPDEVTEFFFSVDLILPSALWRRG